MKTVDRFDSSRPMHIARRALCLFLLGGTLVSISAAAQPWRGREEHLLQILEHGEIVAMKAVGRGVTKPQKVTLEYEGERIDAIWKTLDRRPDARVSESWEAEVAAYRLSRALGLDMVPPTVARKIEGDQGSLQLWVDGYRLYAEAAREGGPATLSWSRQVARMKFFDELIDNPDRHAANYLVDEDWQLVMIDHSRALSFDRRGRQKEVLRAVHFDIAAVKGLENLDRTELETLLGDVLSGRRLKELARSRDRLLERVAKLYAERGDWVFFHPDSGRPMRRGEVLLASWRESPLVVPDR